MGWAAEEFDTINLGDARRDRRAIQLIERLADQPTASIPGAGNGWAETQAAYRFLGSDAYDWQDILAPHRQCTQARMATHPVVLCLPDTTELDFNGQAITGLGPLSYEAQRGMSLHPTYAVTPEREPPGVLDAWMWAREFKDADGQRGGAPESLRWKEGYERVAELAATLPDTRLVYVGDREADIVEWMAGARDLGTPADWLVRAQHNRVLPEGQRLWETVLASAPLGEVRFTLPAGRRRRARGAPGTLRPARPDRGPPGRPRRCHLPHRPRARCPDGVKPVEWRLLTNRLVETLDAAAELIDWYRARWEIEMLFLVLKEGCRVEALQLSTVERLERALALFLIVSWRIARLMRLGRTLPDFDASLLFAREEWEAAYLLAKQPVPTQPPRLNAVLRLIARQGGFLGRKGDGEPGVKTIWLGLQRVRDVAMGIQYAREADGGHSTRSSVCLGRTLRVV